MEKISLPSGAVLSVQPLSYEKAWNVTQILLKELEVINLDLKSIDFKELMAMDILVLKGPICAFLGSPKVLEAAKECFTKCLYNDTKIDSMTFEKKESRGDFIFCCFYALKENVSPFFGSLVSALSTK